jgi:hypothetical protein
MDMQGSRSLRVLLLILAAAMAIPAMAAPPGVPMKMRSVYIFPEKQGSQLLQQCSRDVPQGITGYWTPSDAQVAALKSALGAYIQQHSADRGNLLSYPLESYHGQYAGIVSRGKQLIYGNFYIRDEGMLHEDSQAVSVCDGGHSFFGVVFDPATNQIVGIAFNGVG